MPASLQGFRSLLSVLSLQFEAVGSVTGAFALQLGYTGIACTYWGDTATVPVIATNTENFYNQLWSGAIDRLEQDALRVGADGVVGVSVAEQPVAGIEDGLIGSNVLSEFLITLDFAGGKLRLDPLEGYTPGELQDRMDIAAMKDATRVFRFGHLLMVPVKE